ncbi:MAG TPA: hypothetical protein PKO06_15795, partial [Candidatus Ozemobacteraceae bacterium]|nr:hypothetical protein [Candidatus Ozemobacteraceae bacterium]
MFPFWDIVSVAFLGGILLLKRVRDRVIPADHVQLPISAMPATAAEPPDSAESRQDRAVHGTTPCHNRAVNSQAEQEPESCSTEPSDLSVCSPTRSYTWLAEQLSAIGTEPSRESFDVVRQVEAPAEESAKIPAETAVSEQMPIIAAATGMTEAPDEVSVAEVAAAVDISPAPGAADLGAAQTAETSVPAEERLRKSDQQTAVESLEEEIRRLEELVAAGDEELEQLGNTALLKQ